MKKNRIFACSVIIAFFCFSNMLFAGEYLITKWKPYSSKYSKYEKMRCVKATVKYIGEGSRLIENTCFQATLEDDSVCDGASGDFRSLRVENKQSLTRVVCFCENRYPVRDIIYKCKDSF